MDGSEQDEKPWPDQAGSQRKKTAPDASTYAVPVLRVISEGSLQGRVLAVHPGRQLIGRATGAEIRLTDAYVSRRHALLTCGYGAVRIEDIGSDNGTFVNGERIEAAQPVPLRAGDVVQFGNVETVFDDGLGAPPVVAPPPDTTPTAAVPPVSTRASVEVERGSATSSEGGERTGRTSEVTMTWSSLALSGAAAGIAVMVVAAFKGSPGEAWLTASAVPIVTGFVTMPGPRHGARIAIAAWFAITLAFTGYTVSERLVIHHATFNPHRSFTFLPEETDEAAATGGLPSKSAFMALIAEGRSAKWRPPPGKDETRVRACVCRQARDGPRQRSSGRHTLTRQASASVGQPACGTTLLPALLVKRLYESA
jgi:pSer/pThr/pTyr-binding forkhead associated (FHA) protein